MNRFVLAIIALIVLNFYGAFSNNYENAAETTYTKDVQPIIEKRCSQCHNANWADKNWMDYDTAFKHRDMIKLRVQNESMPPGNTTEMTKEERATIIKWVDGGAKK